MIKTRYLQYFIAVAEELNFSRAAERVHVAQPALSRQIQQLEDVLGVRLLERTQRRVSLTTAGTLYLERARDILGEIERASVDVRRIHAGEIGRLRIGFIHSSTYSVTPLILERFRSSYPEVELVLHEFSIPAQVQALQDRIIDIGILRPPVDETQFGCLVFRNEKFVIAVPITHPLALRDSAAVSELKNSDWVFFNEKHSPLFHSRVVAMCERAGIQPNITQYATQIHTVTGLVRAGFGVSIVPEVVRNQPNQGVHFLEIEDNPPPVQVALAWRRDDKTPTVKTFRDLVAGLTDRSLRNRSQEK